MTKRKTKSSIKIEDAPLPLKRGSISQIIKDAKKYKVICYDVEWDAKNGINPDKPNFEGHGAAFATASGYTKYVTNREHICHIFKKLIPVEGLEWVSHSATADWKAARLSSWIDGLDYPKLICDTMVGANLLYDNLKPNQIGIKNLVKIFFDYTMAQYEESSKQGLDTEEFEDYAMDDAYQELRFYLQIIRPKLIKEELFKYFKEIPAIAAFTDLEICGVTPDQDTAMELIHYFSEKADIIKDEIWKKVGAFNLNSGPQVAKVIVDKLGVPVEALPKTAKGGVKTDADTIDALAKRFSYVKPISYYRTARKMISTYLSPCILEADKNRDRRLYPRYELTSATGRTRCANYNIQNVTNEFYDGPFKGVAIRSVFRAPTGQLLVACDASQGELRLMAHHTKDQALLNAYLKWHCNTCKCVGSSKEILHTCPECGADENEDILEKDVPGFWHGLDLHQQTLDMVSVLPNRPAAKASNFGIGYGAGGYRMNGEHPQLSVEEWDVIIHEWLETYSGVRDFHEVTKRRMRRGKEIENWSGVRKKMIKEPAFVTKDMFGRKRRIPLGEIQRHWKHSFNQILNFKPQAGLCAWCQLAFTKFRKEMVEYDLWMDGVWPFAFVHDEIVLSVNKEFVDEVGQRLQWHIENAAKMSVPMRSSVEVDERWSGLKG